MTSTERCLYYRDDHTLSTTRFSCIQEVLSVHIPKGEQEMVGMEGSHNKRRITTMSHINIDATVHCFMQRPVHPSLGQVKPVVDG